MTWNDIAKIFETMELRLISSLKRNLKRHHDWEKSEGFNWSAWQAEKLNNLEAYRKENRRIMDEYTDQIDAPAGVTIQAIGAKAGSFTLASGGMLVVKEG